MKRVLVPLAEGFEELEAVTIIDILRRAHIEAASPRSRKAPVTGSHGIRLAADTPLAALAEQDFDMIALPGGMPGADHLKKEIHASPNSSGGCMTGAARGGDLRRADGPRGRGPPRGTACPAASPDSWRTQAAQRSFPDAVVVEQRRHHLTGSRYCARFRAPAGRDARRCRRAGIRSSRASNATSRLVA